MAFIKKLCGGTFARMIIPGIAGQGIGNFLDKFGCDKIPGCVEQDILISDLLPADYKEDLKRQALPYLDLVNKFSDDDAYGWIPQRHKMIIENCPGGKDWAIKQIQIVREFILIS